MVTIPANNGPGSLRQALLEARSGDTISFDPAVFPPQQPVTITLLNGLPPLTQGHLTIDASDAGVILDGSQAGGEWTAGLEIASPGNTVRGLQIVGFSGPGILLQPSAQFNSIGGERGTGQGLLGQGNLIVQCSDGVFLHGSDNLIQGNLIGTDLSGQTRLGNRGQGIAIGETASRNTIGPDNVIAYNGSGINIYSAEARSNRITANRIYGNEQPGIYYFYNEVDKSRLLYPPRPAVLDFNLNTGRLEGVCCPDCAVEVFSTRKTDGEIYEGRTIADEYGGFLLEKGAAFPALGLTATCTDSEGNTSEFSSPTVGASGVFQLQAGNSTPRLPLQESGYASLSFNNLGEMQPLDCQDPQFEATRYLARLSRLNLTWLRVALDWFDWPEVVRSGEYSDFEITPCQDRAVDILHQNNIPVLLTLTYWDPEIVLYPGYSRFHDENEVQRYLEYVRFVAGHFKGKIAWYGILNEPNVPGDDQRYVKIDDYINLVRRVVAVLRESDPQAKIVIGEVTPLNELGAYEYLLEIVRSDLMAIVDGIAWHGSSGLSLEYQPRYYLNYPGWVDQIVQSALGNGFQGEFFASELAWRTPDTPQPISGQAWFYSDTVAAKYYARGIVYHRGRGFVVLVGHENYDRIPRIFWVVRSLGELLAGAQPVELPFEIEGPGVTVLSYAFSLPDGSRLLALWRDGVAVDDDPGQELTLAFPGVGPTRAAGLDPLYGFQQELVTDVADGSLTIPDFLLKDYPLLIRIYP